MAKRKLRSVVLVGLASLMCGCLSYSHCLYARREAAARVLPEKVKAVPGRIYFVSFPENRLALSLWGWHPNVGHASLVTNDREGTIKQYDYGWFVGYGGQRPSDAIGYVDASESYGVVKRKVFPPRQLRWRRMTSRLPAWCWRICRTMAARSSCGRRMLPTSALPSGTWSNWRRTGIVVRWPGVVGRSVDIGAATSRDRQLTRHEVRGISSICSGVASPVRMRRASERRKRFTGVIQIEKKDQVH